ncbi:MAG: hypothetical protein FH753_04565 [Firmicutes bacterium]|nr:hypothetical protein [Bacillota bacterium]
MSNKNFKLIDIFKYKKSGISESSQMNTEYFTDLILTEESYKGKYYTAITILIEERADFKAAKLMVDALDRIAKLEGLVFIKEDSIEAKFKLNEWKPNYNREIQEQFQNTLISKILELIVSINIDSYKVTISRCKTEGSAITDKVEVDVSHGIALRH